MKELSKKHQSEWEVRKGLLDKTDYKCTYCGFDFLVSPSNFGAMTWDHLISVRDGGKDEGNLIPACCLCNLLKGGKSFRSIEEGVKELNKLREQYLVSWGYYELKKKYRD